MPYIFRAVTYLGLLCVCTDCLDQAAPPDPGTGTCNGDGICDVTQEDCGSCPTDCTCCNAVLSEGQSSVQDSVFAIGAADGQVALLGANSGLTLTVGREIFDGAGPDFELVGSVESDGINVDDICTLQSSGNAAFEVYVSPDGTNFRLIGIWSVNRNTFDLACAEVPRARAILIQGQSNAEARLDAVNAISCCEEGEPCSFSSQTEALNVRVEVSL